MNDEVMIPERAKLQMQSLWRQLQAAQQGFNVYLQALLDVLDIKTDEYELAPEGDRFLRRVQRESDP